MATLQDLRKARGLSQEDLARELETTRNIISHAETGKAVRRSTLMRICQALAISPEQVEGVNIAARPTGKRKYA